VDKKKSCTFVVAVLMAVALKIPVHAQDGDIYDISTTPVTNHGSVSSIILKDRPTLLNIITKMNSYGYEVSGEIYKVSDVNNEFNNNSTETAAALQSDVKANLTPVMSVPTVTSTISSVSTINVQSVTVGTMPMLPATVSVTLSDVKTNDAKITWDAEASAADTYSTIGTVTIKGTLDDYNNYAVSATVAVTAAVSVESVSLNKTTDNLSVSGIDSLTATINPSNATNQAVTWQSSNTNVAVVFNGLIIALRPGTANITVTTADGNKTASCIVTVN
jgi:uncharacterized protein YjdB